jgi:hypothetical protein
MVKTTIPAGEADSLREFLHAVSAVDDLPASVRDAADTGRIACGQTPSDRVSSKSPGFCSRLVSIVGCRLTTERRRAGGRHASSAAGSPLRRLQPQASPDHAGLIGKQTDFA